MIYYSHINEDSSIERRLLRESACTAVVAICGSGERVLALMDTMACKKFAVVDFNEQALFLLQLKLAALTQLSVQDYLQFIGHYPLQNEGRLQLYDTLKPHLPLEALTFWDTRRGVIGRGILNGGHFERFLHRVKPLITFYLGKNFQQIFSENKQQSSFPEKRWKLLRKLFSYRLVYKLAGNRDVAFVGEKAFVPLIPAALDTTIRERKAASSFMAHLVFRGNLQQMPEEVLPPSLQIAVLTAIKQRLLNRELEVEYHATDLMKYMEMQAGTGAQQVFYSLSDILSFADFDYLKQLVRTMALPANVMVGRSFLRNRLTGSQLDELSTFGQVALHDEQESTGMYQVFSIKTFSK